MSIRNKLFAAAVAILCAADVNAEVKLPAIFADGMVMQRESDCNLWGTAEAGKSVTIKPSWTRQTYKVTAAADGKWSAKVTTPQAGGPYSMTLSDGKETRISDILMGDVWLCSGQSNMEMTMKGYKGQPVEGADEALLSCNDSLMRLFTVVRKPSLTPLTDVKGQWSSATAATVRNFSATAYYFGRALRRSTGVPIGLVVTSYGGSSIEAWMAKEWLKAFPSVEQNVTEEMVKKEQQRCPTALFNGQLMPLVGMTMKGVIWYQGETNIPRASCYAQMMKTMVNGWRTLWGQGAFPFYYCQIAPYDYSLIEWNYNSAELREQQAMAETMIDNCRMAVLLDAGLEYGIHPRKKRQAGERLAMLALQETYGMGKALPDYARYGSVEFQGDTAVISFENSREWVYFENGKSSDLFEICAADSVYHTATVWTSRNHVYVTSPEVHNPVSVRYAWRNYCQGDLMHDGLPVSSFRTTKETTKSTVTTPTSVDDGGGFKAK